MMELMLVAGDDTKQLADYFRERGTFSVNYCYSSLQQNKEQITSQLIKVDKLVYITKTFNQTLRTDLQTLIFLLTSDSFFTVNEIIFICQVNKDSDTICEYFKAAMEASHFSNYSINEIEKALSFTEIYNKVLGITKSLMGSSTFRRVFMKERDSETTRIHKAEDNSKWVVEPFNYDRLEQAERNKIEFTQTDAGIAITDTKQVELQKLDNPSLPRLELNKIEIKYNTFIITGEYKTGKTTWALNIANSAQEAGRRVIIFDLAKHRDIIQTLQQANIAFKRTMVTPIARGVEKIQSNLTVISPEENERDIMIEVLQAFYRRSIATSSDVVLILADLDKLAQIMQGIQEYISAIFCAVVPFKSDVDCAKEEIEATCNNVPVTMLLNTIIPLMSNQMYMSATEVKASFNKEVKVISPINFPDLRCGKELYLALVGGSK